LSVIGLYLIGQQGGTNGAVWIYTAATAVTALAGVWALRIRVPQLRGVVGYFDTRELLRSSLPLFWFTVISQVVLWTPTFLLGIWGNAADVGIYNAAYKTSTVMIFASAATNSIVTPKFSAMFKQGDFDALGFLVRGCAKLTALLAAPISLIFILAPRSVMGIFGEQFIVGAPILTILTIGQFVEVATGAVGQLLIMTGHEKAIRNNIAITAIVNVLLCSVLIPAFGLTGAAIATTTSLTIMNCISVYLVWSNLKIWPLPFFARS
jgi:O-antigen/teichoic acid export membrane protein